MSDSIKRTEIDRIDETIRKMIERSIRFTEGVVSIAKVESMKLAPLEYGTLRNSQYGRVVNEGGKIVGKMGFMANYANYLNGVEGQPLPNWSPRRIEDKKGPATNMNAVPGFITLGFESDASKAAIKAMERVMMV